MSKSDKIVADLIKALRERPVVEAIGAIFEEKLATVMESLQTVQQENVKLTRDLSLAREKIDELERNTKAENLIITGLPFHSFAEAAGATKEQGKAENHKETEQAVLNLLHNEMHIDVSSADISTAYRLRRQGESHAGPPPVLVRLTTRKTRDLIYSSRRALKNSETRVYVNEDLTRTNALLFHHARKAIKEKRLASAWTAGGLVYARLTLDPDAKPFRIKTLDDLPQ